MNDQAQTLLPGAVEVSFHQIESALAEAGQVSRQGRPSPALTATVVVVGPRERLPEAAAALELLTDAGGVRTILIANDGDASPTIRVSHQAIALEGIRPQHVDNAVAALRLSSLPTLVWWRGGDASRLEDLAALADRLVLDAPDPLPAWAIAPALAKGTSVSDVRWTRLTPWRCLMANFFDSPDVVAAAAGFLRLDIDAPDAHAARLFAGWLMSSLRWRGSVAISQGRGYAATALERVRFGDDQQELLLRISERATCVDATARVHGQADMSRAVLLGDESLRALISEELRIRSRDLPFERALQAAKDIA